MCMMRPCCGVFFWGGVFFFFCVLTITCSALRNLIILALSAKSPVFSLTGRYLNGSCSTWASLTEDFPRRDCVESYLASLMV